MILNYFFQHILTSSPWQRLGHGEVDNLGWTKQAEVIKRGIMARKSYGLCSAAEQVRQIYTFASAASTAGACGRETPSGAPHSSPLLCPALPSSERCPGLCPPLRHCSALSISSGFGTHVQDRDICSIKTRLAQPSDLPLLWGTTGGNFCSQVSHMAPGFGK